MTQTPDESNAADPAAAEPEASTPSAELPPGPQPPPTPQAPAASGPQTSRDEVLDFGRLRRTVVDAKVAGVAGGLARHLDIDPVIVRVLFVVSAFFGIGILAYGALWLLVPADDAAKAPIGLDDNTRSVVVMIIGALTLIGLVGMFSGGPDLGAVVFLGAIAIGVVAFIKSRENRRAPQVYAGYPAQPTPAMAYSGPEARAALATDPSSTPPGGYGPAPMGYQPPPPRVPNPRKRGPLLFGFTVALLLLLLGLLGVADVAGVEIAHSAYPALAVAVIGLMLVVGAFYGRAGGLIALGVIASMGLAGSMGAENYDGEKTVAPTNAASVLADYEMGVGELVVDLSQVSDQTELVGREISIDGGVGHILIILPNDVDARIDAGVDGPGNLRLNDQDFGGVETQRTWFNDTAGTGTVTINANLGVGEIEVRTS